MTPTWTPTWGPDHLLSPQQLRLTSKSKLNVYYFTIQFFVQAKRDAGINQKSSNEIPTAV